jgi:hypothetical protein
MISPIFKCHQKSFGIRGMSDVKKRKLAQITASHNWSVPIRKEFILSLQGSLLI